MSEPVTAAVAASAAASAINAAGAASPGFFAASLGFIAGFLLTWPALIAVLVLGVLFEHGGARGWAVFTALVAAVIAYFFFAVPLMTIAIYSVAYIVVGLGWAIWRYKRHVEKTVAENKDATDGIKERVIERLHPKAMLSTITAWIVIWPFSLVENLTGDIINFIQTLVSKVFRGVFHRIYTVGINSLLQGKE